MSAIEPIKVDPATLYVHGAQGRRGREVDDTTERFVDEMRMGVAE